MMKLTSILPSSRQLEFLSWERGVFFHFGIRTFFEGHRDWDGKIMPLDGFYPTDLDCEKWIKTVHDSGFKYAILTAKHHDGFGNWPSKHSDYHVGLTPWKGGRGDVVREFVEACRKYDIKVGLYYSPAEADFKKREAKEYDDYFIAQISELLGDYGKIDYLWFDGNGCEGHEFNKPRIISAIRALQPEILVFNMWDPDVRWVGNEGGAAGITNSNVVSDLDFSTLATDKEKLDEVKFLPSESDFMMRYSNWFYSEYDTHTVKSVEELVGLYYHSVGCGSNFLVNIGPDRRGLLPEIDAERLLEFEEEINRRFGNPLSSEVKKEQDGIVVVLDKEQLVNHLVLTEDLTYGEAVEEFMVYVKSNIIENVVCLYIGRGIGHKRIITFPTIRATELAVKVTKSSKEFSLGKAEVFYVK
jgi:alpha-L-fucosidase